MNILEKFKSKSLVKDVTHALMDKNVLIEEIHKSFYEEVDKLLESARISKSLETDKQHLIDKSNRLKELGFTNSKDYFEGLEEIKRLALIEQDNFNKKRLIKAIGHFSSKYPQYKFITENSVKHICDKYGLVYGEIKYYTGSVPDKNLKDMETFKIEAEDCCYIESYNTGWSSTVKFNKGYSDFKYRQELPLERANYGFNTNSSFFDVAPLEIVAPFSDFIKDTIKVENFKISKIEIPDPIILKPVFHDNSKYYLIITAWGLEASDELVQKMN